MVERKLQNSLAAFVLVLSQLVQSHMPCPMFFTPFFCYFLSSLIWLVSINAELSVFSFWAASPDDSEIFASGISGGEKNILVLLLLWVKFSFNNCKDCSNTNFHWQNQNPWEIPKGHPSLKVGENEVCHAKHIFRYAFSSYLSPITQNTF